MIPEIQKRSSCGGLAPNATREEVLAAVAAQDKLEAELRAMPEPTFPGMPEDPADRRGCYWSSDGAVIAHYGDPDDEDPVIARQRVAGEEDQSVPGWDFGA